MTSRTRGIILKSVDWREASQLFSIYTQQLGKVVVLGQGTKKINSKLNGHLQPFCVIDLMVAKGKNSDRITGALILKSFSQIRSDFKKIIFGSFALELIDQLTSIGQPDVKIFNLLISYLTKIDSTNRFDKDYWQTIRNDFVTELMTILGYKPKAEVSNNTVSLNRFLKYHLDRELRAEKLIRRVGLD